MNVELVEVAPRDGLQNEPLTLPPEARARLVCRLVACGLSRIEVASFVNERHVPQMADAEDVVSRLPRGTASYIGVALNRRGYERALAAGIDEVNLVVVCTDEFSRRNQGRGTDEVLAEMCELLTDAAAAVATTVTLAAAFGCPFEGEVATKRVASLAEAAASAGANELALADTIGCAIPRQVRELVAAVASTVGNVPLRCHFHNTRNTGYANAFAAVEAGVTTLDASIGGIGGCPFAPRATGNIATEDLAWQLRRSGYGIGNIDMDNLLALHDHLAELGIRTSGLVGRAGVFPPEREAAGV
ncbi:MAG TPA: hydroxymethylglutaryl-CoA lyase [Gaiellaceae bacterium]|nr:hydroxymethylglutaryl-CoA lyase [Gaiellaceae bacterium]